MITGKKLYVTDSAESRAVAGFLTRASNEPCALVIEGEAGIGKTTFWLAVQEHAREHGFNVLSARPAQAETVLAYSVLADLLASVDPATWTDLPHPQRLAIDRVMLRATDDDVPADPRAVGAAFVAIVEQLAHNNMVLAIDDLQWVDPSSASAIAFATRRVSGPIGVVAAVRTGQAETPGAWLQLHRPDAVHRIELQPMSLGALHRVVHERLGRSFPRPTMVRIHEVSGGNPFYAIELARAIDGPAANTDLRLPPTLAELVRARLDGLDSDAQDLVLATACAGEPTVELLATALGHDPKHLGRPLERAEATGILVLDGHRVRFSHPLLASGVYTAASPAQRRLMHRKLAGIVAEPELRARHLALSVTHGDPETFTALDAAAERARIRGAPLAAAELLDLAVKLGGDIPERRIQLAGHYFSAGDVDRARTLLESTISGPTPQPLRAHALTLLGAIEMLHRSLVRAVGVLERALDEAGDDLALRVQILVPMAFALYNTSDHAALERRVDEAVADADRLGRSDLLSQALSTRTVCRFWLGRGLDEDSLRRALDLADGQASVSVFSQPSMHKAILLSCTGQLDSAHNEFASLMQSYVERGEEGRDQNYVAFHRVLNDIWRGDFASATLLAEDAVERGRHVGGLNFVASMIMRAHCAAYAGRASDARRDANDVLEMVDPAESIFLTGWPMTILGFLEVSLGNYDAALRSINPLLDRFRDRPQATEIYVAACLPDAAEAMIALGRITEAEPLIDALERNGRRLDRPWMLAVGARCRAMQLAAHRDLNAALEMAQYAMVEHQRLPMPFEHARTQLLLGQLQRRRRMKSVASQTLRSVLQTFEELGTPLWAERTRAELARVKVGPQPTDGLSPSEQRVAELAASGMTNREVAAAMSISPKTVESNLIRIYRKLGIRSRAELGQRIGRPAAPL